MKKLFLMTAIMLSWSLYTWALGSNISSHIPLTDTEINGIEVDLDESEDSAESWEYECVDIEEIYHFTYPWYTQEIYESKGREYPLKNIMEDFDAEQYEKIISDAEAVLKEVPDSHEARFYAAGAYYFSGMTQKAFDYILKLAVDYPTENYFKYAVGWCVADRNGALGKADAMVKKAVADNYYYPDEVNEALRLLVEIAINTGYLYDALDYIDLMKENEDILPYMNIMRASIYNLMDKPEAALKMLEAIPEDFRDNNWISDKLIYLRNAEGVDAAIDYARELLIENPEWLFLNFSIIQNLALRGDHDDAINLCADMLELVDDRESVGELYLRRAFSRNLNGDTQGAIDDFNKVLEVADANSSFAEIANCYLGQGESVINKRDSLSEDYFYTTVYIILGQPEKALECLSKAFKDCSWSPIRSKYDLHHQSLINHPGYKAAAAHFQPQKRKL